MSRPATRRVPLRRRLLLYVPLGALVVLLVAVTWYFRRPSVVEADQHWTEVDYATLEQVDLLRRYVRIDTSETTGSEIDGARFLAAELERMGLEPHLEILDDGHANVWAVLEGESPDALVLHNHIDVSPADLSTWDFDPFGAEIDQAWLYGRGVFDMKSLAIVQLLALKELAAAEQRPRRSLVFLATGSEETGSELGTRWILEQHPELASRFWAVLTEGGTVEPTSRTDIKYWGIEFGQKRFATAYLCAESREHLDSILVEILFWQRYNERLVVKPEIAAFGAAYGPSRDRDIYRRALLDPDAAILDYPWFRELPAYIQALYRNEAVPFPVEPAPGGGFRMKVIFHLLPGESFEDVRDEVLPDWLIHDVGFTVGEVLGADRTSPLDHEVFTALVASVDAAYPGAPVGPHFVSWSASDARFFRQAGVPAYGFSPFLIFSTDTFRVDGSNERISLPGYMSGFELYLDAVRRLVE